MTPPNLSLTRGDKRSCHFDLLKAQAIPIAKKKPDAAVLIPPDELLTVEVVQACENYADSSAPSSMG